MTNYFRITGYCQEHDFSFIIDCYGMFDEIWQFSSLLVKKGLKVLAVGDTDKFLDINIKPIEEDKEHLILRANTKGQPEYIEYETNGVKYKAIKIASKIYIPDKTKIIF